MHTAQSARETLEFLWDNYLELCKRVDVESMPQETLQHHIDNETPWRPLRIATWLARQGYFISAWNLWEYYARSLCRGLKQQVPQRPGEATVDWVNRSLAANAIAFADHAWFASANCVRNLIAHSGSRVDSDRSRSLLERARVAFPALETLPDGYLHLVHDHVADLDLRIEDFIEETGGSYS